MRELPPETKRAVHSDLVLNTCCSLRDVFVYVDVAPQRNKEKKLRSGRRRGSRQQWDQSNQNNHTDKKPNNNIYRLHVYSRVVVCTTTNRTDPQRRLASVSSTMRVSSSSINACSLATLSSAALCSLSFSLKSVSLALRA